MYKKNTYKRRAELEIEVKKLKKENDELIEEIYNIREQSIKDCKNADVNAFHRCMKLSDVDFLILRRIYAGDSMTNVCSSLPNKISKQAVCKRLTEMRKKYPYIDLALRQQNKRLKERSFFTRLLPFEEL